MDFIFDPSLVLYLLLEQLDGSSFMPKDAYGRLCSVTGAALEPGRGRYFDGMDDWLDLSDDRFDSLTEGTILLWAKADGGGNERVFGCDLGNNNDRMNLTRVSSKLQCFAKKSGVAVLQVDGSTTLNDSDWYLLGYTSGPASNALYVNGLAETVTYTTGDAATHLFFDDYAAGTTYYSLGRAWAGAGYDYGNVTIGEVFIYSRALMPQEIQHIYLKTKWRYR